MLSSPPAASPQALLRRLLSGVARVFVVPVSADGLLLLHRHESERHCYWTYPTMQRGTMRTDPATVARRLLREELGTEPDGLRLVHVLPAARTHARSAVYAVGLGLPAAEILAAREATGTSRRALQALAVTAETLAALDVRPLAINDLMTAGGIPARTLLSLPDLADPGSTVNQPR
jgi:ADP-ribose pyrophosphatase YjhB (NUDIX family)